jgi:hypothetical protein
MILNYTNKENGTELMSSRTIEPTEHFAIQQYERKRYHFQESIENS